MKRCDLYKHSSCIFLFGIKSWVSSVRLKTAEHQWFCTVYLQCKISGKAEKCPCGQSHTLDHPEVLDVLFPLRLLPVRVLLPFASLGHGKEWDFAQHSHSRELLTFNVFSALKLWITSWFTLKRNIKCKHTSVWQARPRREQHFVFLSFPILMYSLTSFEANHSYEERHYG